MEINSTLASQLYSQAQAAAKPADNAVPVRSASESFETAAASFVETLRASEDTVKAGLAGRADPQAVVEALAATELAVQTAITVRDRVVEAYQEILRMPV